MAKGKQKIERMLRSKFYRSVVVTDAFKTLEISQPEGELREVVGIQVKFNAYPRPEERAPATMVMLPREDAFEVAREIIRAHRGPSEVEATKHGLVADHVGFHAMSVSEALMVEAIMLWESASARLACWQAVRFPSVAQELLACFVENMGDDPKFEQAALSILKKMEG